MVVGRKAKLPSLLIFSSVNRRAGSESVCVCARSGTSQDHVKIG